MEKYNIIVIPDHSFIVDKRQHVPKIIIEFPPVFYEDYPNQTWVERDELVKIIERLFVKGN